MAAPICSAGDDSSTSESDSEEKKRIREALAPAHIFASAKLLTGTHNEARTKQEKKPLQPPSNRPVEKFQQENILEVTPEFRKFVGKKLSEFIDSTITLDENLESLNKLQNNPDNKDTGIRLFRSSQKLSVNDTSHNNEAVKRKKPVSSSSDSDEAVDRLASVAVSGDQILAHSQIPSSSNVSHNCKDDTNSIKVKKKKKKKKKHKELHAKNSSDSKQTESELSNSIL